jgi:AraC-like DNA-binding protein
MLHQQFIKFFCQIQIWWTVKSMPATTIISLQDHYKLKGVAAFIEENCCGNRAQLTIKFLSKKFAICSTSLKIIFKKQHSLTVHQFIMQTRMRKAEEYLLHHPAINVARKCGYNDYGNFCRDFKKVMGASPNAHNNKSLSQVLPSKMISVH